MQFLDAGQIKKRTNGIVHDRTQFASFGLDLTAARVGRFIGPGALDFGGSEFEEAPVEWLDPQKQSDEDEYGWWDLDGGQYVVEFNETLDQSGDGVALVQPLPRLMQAGSSHPSFQPEQEEPIRTVLQVGRGGLRIKENARISRLSFFRVS